MQEVLDSQQSYAAVDPQGMYDLIKKFPAQLLKGIGIANNIDKNMIDTDSIQNIVLLGMGGSAIGGDLVRAFAVDELGVPFIINRNYQVPGFINNKTLVIASSYSGNTEETLTALDECIKKKAQIIAISTNGKLEEIARENNLTFLQLPKGYPPRAALGFSFSTVLMVLSNLGLISDYSEDLNDANRVLEKGIEAYSRNVPAKKNPIKGIAKKLFGKLPIIYTSTKFWNSVGVRIRGQIEENAKMLAYSAQFPEMNHNEIVGWNRIENIKPYLVPIFIVDKDIYPRVRFRMDFTADLLNQMGIDYILLEGKGEKLLSRILSIIQIGDFISYYLSILNRADPMPVDIIEKLKEKLAKFNHQ